MMLAIAVSCMLLAASPEEAAVLERVSALAAAFERADAAGLAALVAPGYVHTNGGSPPIDATRWLDYVRTRKQQLASGTLRLTRYENTDVRVVVAGDTAVVTGENVSEGTRDGTAFRTRLRFTQTWVRTADGWKRLAFQDAAVP